MQTLYLIHSERHQGLAREFSAWASGRGWTVTQGGAAEADAVFVIADAQGWEAEGLLATVESLSHRGETSRIFVLWVGGAPVPADLPEGGWTSGWTGGALPPTVEESIGRFLTESSTATAAKKQMEQTGAVPLPPAEPAAEPEPAPPVPGAPAAPMPMPAPVPAAPPPSSAPQAPQAPVPASPAPPVPESAPPAPAPSPSVPVPAPPPQPAAEPSPPPAPLPMPSPTLKPPAPAASDDEGAGSPSPPKPALDGMFASPGEDANGADEDREEMSDPFERMRKADAGTSLSASADLAEEIEALEDEVAAGAEETREEPAAQEVRTTVFCPEQLKKGRWFTLQVWLHFPEQKEVVRKLATESGHQDQAGLKAGLVLADDVLVGFTLAPNYLYTRRTRFGRRKPVHRYVHWTKQPTNVEFPVFCPRSFKDEVLHERLEITVEGIPVGTCTITLAFDQAGEMASALSKIETAFASYSSKDREHVIGRLQILEGAVGMKTFFDVESLRMGDDWEQRLVQEVPTKDKFLLFWSPNARKSKWVEKEWRLALKERGLDYILPVPIRPAAPPKLLSKLQFNDRYARMADYERLKKEEEAAAGKMA